jgi:hypothetical protein
MGQFDLGSRFATEELDPIQDQHIALAAEFFLENLRTLRFEAMNHIVDESLSGRIVDPVMLMVLLYMIADRAG